jgi:hypothetical protein
MLPPKSPGSPRIPHDAAWAIDPRFPDTLVTLDGQQAAAVHVLPTIIRCFQSSQSSCHGTTAARRDASVMDFAGGALGFSLHVLVLLGLELGSLRVERP